MNPRDSLPDSHLDMMEIGAKNRILSRPDDPGNAPDVLALIREIRRLYGALEHQASQVEKLGAKLRAAEKLPAFEECQAPHCERSSELGSRYCHVHLAEVRSAGNRRARDWTEPEKKPNRLGRLDGRCGQGCPQDDPSPAFENALRTLEG